jgi:hypothetical protein
MGSWSGSINTSAQTTTSVTGGTNVQGSGNKIGDDLTFGPINANTTSGSNNTVTASGGGQVTYNTYNGASTADTLSSLKGLFGQFSAVTQPSAAAGVGGGGGFFSSMASPQNQVWVIAGVVIAGLSLLFLILKKKS